MNDFGLQDAINITLILSGIPLAVCAFVGLIVSILQAATQIQDSTLTFVPKLVALSLVFLFTGHWMLGMMTDYLGNILNSITGI